MSPRRVLLLGLALALLVVPALLARAPGARPPGLIGPFAELAAELQWVRFEGALARGEEARALVLAESALALAPRVNAGWQRLAAYQGYELASRELEPEPAHRRAWLAAAEATLTRGTESAARPAELALFHALLLFTKAEQDPELAGGGAPELRARGRARLARAAELGSHEARELLPYVRADDEAR